MKRQSKSAATSSGANPKSTSSSQINTSVGESTTPITPHEGTSTATPEVQGTQATELEDDGSAESILEALKRKERSDIWNHFERDMVDGRIKGKCNYCGKIYYADPRKNGTTSLNNHMDRCPKYPPNIEMMKAKRQKIFSFKKPTTELCTVECTQEELSMLCVEYIILDELPFSHVEGEGFRRFMGRALPYWRIPSRKTSPRMVEALICTQNWLRSENVYLHHMPTVEEMELCEEAEREMLKMSCGAAVGSSRSGMLPPKSKPSKSKTSSFRA
ncbi:uncharacterized protein LOC112182724 [Rosa chinensis]|uniref:uncharacterized protein LOC112182724 n=1 Tax=Rosa chinensis TaxID=74649 RepID=UPI000D08BE4F|nr:uncharacterized protein LOC112182724 [Rosa chinensis]